jgi:diguanylate cyclase (GGDEF)-like protein
MRTAINFGLLPWNFWVDNSTIIAMAAESLLSSLAIAYRIHLLSRERDAAQAGAIAAQLLADTDPLTGLLNRRSFLSRAIGRQGEQQMMIIDIDHFKRVNDTLGHDGGDEVLRLFARMLRDVAGEGALTARIGGEEFVLVQDAANAISPNAVLDRLRTARMPFDLTVTASIGCCTGTLADEKDWKSLYRRADRALFDAKAAGRDRVRNAMGAAA